MVTRLSDKGERPVIYPHGEPGGKPDPVNHPPHYTSHPSGVECIEIARHHAYEIGCVIKYVWRAGLKVGTPEKEIEDLKKAEWYLRSRINDLENNPPNHGVTQ